MKLNLITNPYKNMDCKNSFVNLGLSLRRKNTRTARSKGEARGQGEQRFEGLNLSREKGSLAELNRFVKVYDFWERRDERLG